MPLRRIPLIPLVFALTALVGASCAQLENLPTLSKADLKAPNLAETSKIFDEDGRLIKTLHGVENRTLVPIGQIPRKVRRAVIAIEDERFYEHDGVDFKAIIRAAVANATSGEIREGGSTITQQYVKNVIISPGETAEKTFSRKLEEAVLARQLEQKLPKKEILERYLNTVYFGNGAYGIQAAGKTYFHKTVEDLSLAEAALLAGLIRSPDTYDPYEQPRAALARRNVVLDKIADLGWIDEASVLRAKAKGLDQKKLRRQDTYPAPYFVDYVERLIEFDGDRFGEALGPTRQAREKALFTGGLRIDTTLDLDTQAAADEAVDYYLSEEGQPYGSLVAIEPETGYVRAMVGGRNFFAERDEDKFAKLNLAIQREPKLGWVKDCGAKDYELRAPGCGRQAGSAYKPFALVAALQEGITLSKSYEAQECMTFPEYNWRPCNYEEADLGEMSLLKATADSVNVVYAQVALEIGPSEVTETAKKMGITTPQDPYASAVLGTNPVNPLNMASAFGTLATNGEHTPPIAITRITDAQGHVLYEADEDPYNKTERVIQPAVAYITTTALEEVICCGTGTNANIYRPAAGKTGTAQEYRDAWFAGYTPDLVAAVWVGYPQGQVSMATAYGGGPVFGGSWPAQIWARFMTQALAGVQVTDFDEPEGDIIEVVVDERYDNCLAGAFTPDEYRETVAFQEGLEPTETCRAAGETEEVPDLIGYPVGEAIAALEGIGFEVALEYDATASYEPGRVIAQDPDPESVAELGSLVTLVVSIDESANGTVPYVLGSSEGDATDELIGAGYNVNSVTEAESNPNKASRRSGLVWKQDPSSGTALDFGETVTIWVNP